MKSRQSVGYFAKRLVQPQKAKVGWLADCTTFKQGIPADLPALASLDQMTLMLKNVYLQNKLSLWSFSISKGSLPLSNRRHLAKDYSFLLVVKHSHCCPFFKVICSIPGTEILAALTPSVLTTTQTAIDRFGPKDRDCYLDSEFKFQNLRWEDGLRSLMSDYLIHSHANPNTNQPALNSTMALFELQSMGMRIFDTYERKQPFWAAIDA